MRHGLARLRTAEFLYETRLFPDVEYTFKHALTHELAYGSLLHDRRRTLHARIVEAVERVWADRLSEHVERLAYHAVRGEVWTKAVSYLRQAGAKAMSRCAYREAVGCLEQALDALRHLPAGRETLECAVDIRFELRTALYPLGEFERTLAHLREAQPPAEALGDDRRLARISAYLCVALRRLGDFEGAIEAGERSLALANAIDDLSLRAPTTLYLGQALWLTGAHRRAVDVFRENVDSLTHDELRQRFGAPGHPGVFSMTDLASVLVELGDFLEAKRFGEAGLAVAEELAHPFTSIAAYLAVAHVSTAAGEFATAIARLERARSLCDRGDFPIQRIMVQARLGYAYLFSKRLADGLALLEEAAQHVDRIDGFYRPRLLGWLSEGYLLSGRVDDAAREAERAMAITPPNAPGVRAWMLRLAGDVASHGEPVEVERAAGYYRDAGSLAEALEMRLLHAHCRLGLGTLYRRAGKRALAQEHLTTAAAMYREMGMGFWLEKAEVELGPPQRTLP
jgi:tetratricopeptide (TPR) repeat protein